MTRRQRIGGAIIFTVIGAGSDPYRYEPPWRGALTGLASWLFIMWMDADPQLRRDVTRKF